MFENEDFTINMWTVKTDVKGYFYTFFSFSFVYVWAAKSEQKRIPLDRKFLLKGVIKNSPKKIQFFSYKKVKIFSGP